MLYNPEDTRKIINDEKCRSNENSRFILEQDDTCVEDAEELSESYTLKDTEVYKFFTKSVHNRNKFS